MKFATFLLALAATMPAAAQQPATLPAVRASLLACVIRTGNAAALVNFYQNVLGMRIIMSRDLRAIHETLLSFRGDPLEPGIMLISPGASASPANPPRGQGATRLTLRVVNIDAVIARLDAANIAHRGVREVEKGLRVLELRDPDQNELELVQGNLGK